VRRWCRARNSSVGAEGAAPAPRSGHDAAVVMTAGLGIPCGAHAGSGRTPVRSPGARRDSPPRRPSLHGAKIRAAPPFTPFRSRRAARACAQSRPPPPGNSSCRATPGASSRAPGAHAVMRATRDACIDLWEASARGTAENSHWRDPGRRVERVPALRREPRTRGRDGVFYRNYGGGQRRYVGSARRRVAAMRSRYARRTIFLMGGGQQCVIMK